MPTDIGRLSQLTDFSPCASGGSSEDNIARAEQTLGLRLANDYRAYVAAFGEASANGHELTGVCPFPRLDVVSITQEERERNPEVPADWYVIEQTGVDRIVIWQDAAGTVWQTAPGGEPTKIADSLLEYLTM